MIELARPGQWQSKTAYVTQDAETPILCRLDPHMISNSVQVKILALKIAAKARDRARAGAKAKAMKKWESNSDYCKRDTGAAMNWAVKAGMHWEKKKDKLLSRNIKAKRDLTQKVKWFVKNIYALFIVKGFSQLLL